MNMAAFLGKKNMKNALRALGYFFFILNSPKTHIKSMVGLVDNLVSYHVSMLKRAFFVLRVLFFHKSLSPAYLPFSFPFTIFNHYSKFLTLFLLLHEIMYFMCHKNPA